LNPQGKIQLIQLMLYQNACATDIANQILNLKYIMGVVYEKE